MPKPIFDSYPYHTIPVGKMSIVFSGNTRRAALPPQKAALSHDQKPSHYKLCWHPHTKQKPVRHISVLLTKDTIHLCQFLSTIFVQFNICFSIIRKFYIHFNNFLFLFPKTALTYFSEISHTIACLTAICKDRKDPYYEIFLRIYRKQ